MRPPTPTTCLASRKLRDCMVASNEDISSQSRKLDIAWGTLRRLLDGRLRPSIDLAAAISKIYPEITFQDWLTDLQPANLKAA